MRFVVFKGIQGFGDRMQCLLQAIRYARASGRLLVIDWRDPDWTHDPELETDHFFSVVGVPTFGLCEFLTYYASNSQLLKVIPSTWTSKLLDANYSRWIYDQTFWTDPKNEQIDLISSGQVPDFEADIVVYCGVGSRSFTYADAHAVRLSHWVEHEIRKVFFRESLEPQTYDVVHLRGGSKSWTGGYVPLADLRAQIDQRWANQASYLSTVYEAYNNGLKRFEGKLAARLLVLSDSERLAEAWMVTYNLGMPLKTFNRRFRESGLHKLTKRDLSLMSPKLSKTDINFELIRDFVLMLNARQIANDGMSLFSEMARGFSSSGVRWLSN